MAIVIKPHPFSYEVESCIRDLYAKHMASEAQALRFLLDDLAQMGYREQQVQHAYYHFVNSNPSTYSIRYFRSYLLRHFPFNGGKGGARDGLRADGPHNGKQVTDSGGQR